ncbi:MAG: four helix bundle protein [Lutibacter sp.]|nr:MAG: four helix bundle protein [Lutibacter sp.]
MKTYRELIIWQKSMKLVTLNYQITKNFPETEKFGLTSQIQRSAISIPSNIAEGYGRNSLNDYIRFLNISNGSLYELQTQIEIAYNLKYTNKETFEKVYENSREIERMMSSLIRKLKEKR